MKHFLAVTLVSSLTLGGMFSAGVVFGETEYGARHRERQMERAEHHGAGGRHHDHHAKHHGPSGGRCEHHAKHHGRDGDRGHHGAHGRYMGKELFARHWKRTLTPEQRAQVDQLRVDHAKANAPLRAKMSAIKTDLAVLATVEEPDTAAMQQHIDELVELKKTIMKQRYAHITSVRKVLTQEQRPSYDMMILQRANKRKRGGRW